MCSRTRRGAVTCHSTHLTDFSVKIGNSFSEAQDILAAPFNLEVNSAEDLAEILLENIVVISAYLVVRQSDPMLEFLPKVWPNMKDQLCRIQDMFDPSSGGDGVIRGMQQNTYDTAMEGANTFIGNSRIGPETHIGASQLSLLYEYEQSPW